MPKEALTPTAPAAAATFAVRTRPNFISVRTLTAPAFVMLPAIFDCTSEKTFKAAPLTPIPAEPPAALMEIRRTLALLSLASPSALAILELMSDTFRGLFALVWVKPCCARSAPVDALTVISPPAVRVAPSSTSA